MKTNPNGQTPATLKVIGLSTLMILSGACNDANGDALSDETMTRTGAAQIDAQMYSNGLRSGTGRGDGMRSGAGRGYGRHRGNRRGEPGHFRGMGRRGAGKGFGSVGLLREALNLTTLSNAQHGAIRGLIEEQRTAGRPASKRFDAGFRTQLADAVRAGHIDMALMSQRRETMDTARKAHIADRNRRLDTLHKTLSADQRVALVDRVRARVSAGGDVDDRSRGRRGKGRGRFARNGGMSDENLDLGRPSRSGRGLFRMVQGLALTPKQQTAIDTLMEKQRDNRPSEADRTAKREALRKCREAFLDSFASETFDAATQRCPRFSDDERESRRTRRAEGMNELIQILTESQRQLLADRLSAGISG